MVEEYIQICEEKGYVKPTWYQGQYSIVCRTAESALLPALRKHGIKFTAYRYVLLVWLQIESCEIECLLALSRVGF